MASTVERPPTDVRILDAAEVCVRRLGLRRLSMADVARQAGMSRGAVYLHFEGRAALVDAVLARAAARFVASSTEVVRRRRTLAGQVGEAAVFIRRHLSDDALTLGLPADDENLLAALLSAQRHHLVSEWIEFWVPYVQAAEERGELPRGIEPRRTGEWIVRIMLSFAIMPSITFDGDDPGEIRRFVREQLR